ncbi:MAG: translocation/assembly module TamB domain-containing protein [Nitrospirae bacterium]|nr:translocation/assembly module TamB domain-containing protein [Nitrospirota bacterium]
MWKKKRNQLSKDEDHAEPNDLKTPPSPAKKILILLLILFLIVSTNIFLHSNLLSEMIHPIIVTQLEKVFGEGVRIGKVSLNLLPTSIEITDFSLIGPVDHHKTPLFSAKKVRVNFSPLSLITEVFLIKKISLTEPVVTILEYGKDISIKSLLNPMSAAGSGSRKKVIVIRRIEIREGGVNIKAMDGGLEAQIAGLNAVIEPDLTMQNYQISASLRDIMLSVSGATRRLAQVEWKAALHPDYLEIRRLEAGSGDLLLSLMGTISGFEEPRINLEVKSSTGLDDIDRLYPPLKGINGKAEAAGEISGKYPDILWRGRLSLKNLSYESSPLGEMSSAVSLSRDQIMFSNASADIFGGHLTGNMTSSISPKEGPRYHLQLIFEKIKTEEVKKIIPEGFPVPGKTIDGNISLQGIGLNRESLSGDGEIRISGRPDEIKDKSSASWKEILISLPEDIQLAFTISAGDLNIRTMKISSAGSILEMSGQVFKNNDMDLSVRSGIRVMKTFLEGSGITDLAGDIDLAGKLRGNISSPLFQGKIEMNDVLIKGVSINRFSSNIVLTKEEIELSNALAETGVATYKFNGKIAWRDGINNPYIDLAVKINSGSPAEIARMFHKEVRINTPITGEMSVKGYVRELNLLANLSIRQGEIYGQSIDSGRADLAINNMGIRISTFILKKNKSILKGTGWIGFDGAFKSTMKAEALGLEDLDIISDRIPNIKGKASIELSGAGTFTKPQILGGISIIGLSYQGSDMGDARIEVWTQAEDLNFKARINDRLTAKGKVGLKGSLPVAADISLTDMPVGIFLDLVHPELPSRVSAVTSGRVSINGNLADPKSIHTDILLTNLNIDISGYQVRNDKKISIEIKGEEARIVSFSLRGEGTLINIKGGSIARNELNIFVEGEADLSLLKLFTRDIALSKGRAVFALTVSDKWEDPKIRGDLKVIGGIVRTNIVLTQSINITAMNLLFNERQILLEKFEGLVGSGNIHGSGKIDIKNMSVAGIEMILEFKEVRHALISDFNSMIDGTLIFQANNKSRRLTGEIDIKKGKYEKRIDMNRWLIEVRKITSAQRPAKASNDVSLNIHFYGKDGIWINNNIAKIPLELDLYLKGSVNRPVLLGRIDANDGSVFFRGNEFKVKSGTVDFLDPKATKPQFDFKINTKVRTYKIDTSLAGTLDRFDLQLSSNPPLSETDILALLTVGRTSTEFTQTQKNIGKEAAASLLVEELVQEKVQGITGVDRFQVDPYYSGVKSSSGPKFTVEKKLLDDRMSVTYASTLDPSVEELIQVEYRLAGNISLIGTRDEKGLLGGDIRFRFEFK